MSAQPILEARGIVKRFPGVLALDGVSFDVRPGEVHVLIGENGAGKSTLSKILMGVLDADEGEILFEGRPLKFRSPLDALQHGIGGVYQEFMLVPWLNVAQNIFLNREPRRWQSLPFLNHRRMHEEARQILAGFGLEVDTRLPVKHLDTALQQMVEISRVLATNPRVLVLDEPTAMLTEREVNQLFERIAELRRKGVAIIYISHRLQEIRRIGDRVTVLRDGRNVGTVNIKDASDDALVEMMVGRSISQMYPRTYRQPGAEALRLKGFSVRGGPQEVDLVVHYGEIVGLAGLVGAGRTELVRGIFGVDPIQKGELYLDGRPVIPRSPHQMIRYGVGLLSEDRKRFGLALKIPVCWNTVMASLRRHFPRGFVQERKVQSVAQEYVEKLRIVTPSVLRQVRYLSGGNQQKVVMAKWLDTKAKILIFDEPTRGIDVGAKAEVHALMDQLAAEGHAIIMISSDLPEVLGMSDRIYVLFQKRIVGEFLHEEANQEKIASLMLGIGAGVKASVG